MARHSTKTRSSDDGRGLSLNASRAGQGATPETYQDYERQEVPGISPVTGLLMDTTPTNLGVLTNASTFSDGSVGTGPNNIAFDRARKLAKQNYWLRDYMRTSCLVHNFGLHITGRVDTDFDTLKAWLDFEAPVSAGTVEESQKSTLGVPSGATISNKERLSKFIADCWYEYLLLENLIVGWIGDTNTASLLSPERCIYRDVMGVETLIFFHGLNPALASVLDPKQQELFKNPYLIFDPSKETFFRVLKTERAGSGLSLPSVQSIFRTLGTMDSMEIGESAYAYGGRMKFRHWKVGHEIKTGNMAGKPTHFWKKIISTTIRGIFSDKRGFLGDYVGNFDQELLYPHEPIEYYKAGKWESSEHRLMKWGGPLAHMMDAEGLVPFLSQLLRAQVTGKRNEFGPFMSSVINQAFGLPDGVKIDLHWSDELFWDSKTFADLLKSGMAGGPISQETFRITMGVNNDVEVKRKKQEAIDKKANPGQFEPAFDAAHGDPGMTPGGRPSGGTNADNHNAP